MLVDVDWTPTTKNLQRLPEPVRRYIHDLQADTDPAGLMRQNFRLRQENSYLRRECERLVLLARLEGRATAG